MKSVLAHLPRMLLLAAALAACDRAGPEVTGPSGLTSGEFIELYMKLWSAQRSAPETFPQQKQAILAEAGVDEERLSAFIREHSADVRMMARLWDSIQTRMNAAMTSIPE